MSTTTIKGIKPSDGTTYQIDYNSLANTPTIPDIPSYDSDSDEGKVLTVGGNDDTDVELSWESVPALLGATYANTGDVLVINDYGDPEWSTLDAIPHHNNTDFHKVLTVADCSGELGWESVCSLIDTDNAIPGDVLVLRDNGTIAWATPVITFDGSNGVINWDYHD